MNSDAGVQEEGEERPSLAAVVHHPLFSHGMCRWTGCEEAGFSSVLSFKHHLAHDHVLDEKSTAQTRVQVRCYDDN